MGDRKVRKNELKRARNFIYLLRGILQSETITKSQRAGMNELINKISLQIEMRETGIIKQKEFSSNLDEVV